MQELLEMRGVVVSDYMNAYLNKIDFVLKEGEMHAVVNASEFFLQGFLSILKGDVIKTAGELIQNGRLIDKMNLNEISFIDQKPHVLNGFTGLENIFINDKSFYMKRKKTKASIMAELTEKFHLPTDLSKDVITIPAEEKRLIEALRAYIEKKRIVVFYDTLNMVSERCFPAMLSILTAIRSQGKGVIYATTNIEDAISYSTNITAMNRGAIAGTYRTSDIINKPGELINLIPVWDRIYEDVAESYEKRGQVLDALAKSREIISSNMEIRRAIQGLSEDFAQALQADGCIIYLIGEEPTGIISSLRDDEENAPRLLDEIVIRCPARLWLTEEHEGFESYFMNGPGSASTVYCSSVISSGKIIGCVEVWFNRRIPYDEKMLRFLESFSNEVAIAKETSKLMGESVLLQESHHRIKNNLQMIISLMYMQKVQSRNRGAGDMDLIFNDTIRRIKSIAAVHDLFSLDDLGLGIINLSEVTGRLVRMYSIPGIIYDTDVDVIGIPYNKVTSIALIINELINNSVKYAFPEGFNGDKIIRIHCKRIDNEIELNYSDTGIGFTDEFLPLKSDNLGFQIISSIVESLMGDFEVKNNGGVDIRISIPSDQLYL